MTADALDIESVAAIMRFEARRGVFRGDGSRDDRRYLRACRRIAHGTQLIFTRDVGHHACGWWKNPGYERCWHLSMSPAPAEIWTPGARELDRKLRDEWLRAFYRDDVRYIWAEPPYTPEGKAAGVWHYRVFVDPSWSPIIPRGEVYTREFTELGWLSASDLGLAIEQAAKAVENGGP
jgi:hypothetical protein